ncbi:MAG: FIST N-terminal domain-containing protein [Bacteroidota bacterium]
MKVGVGFSERSDSFQAGKEAAENALKELSTGKSDLIMLFATSKHNSELLLNGVRVTAGEDAKLMGGSTVGIITNDKLGYAGYQVGVAAFSLEGVEAHLLFEENLVNREFETATALGMRLNEITDENSNLIVFYDSVKKLALTSPPQLNLATPIVDGLRSSMKTLPNMAGAGLLGDAMFQLPCAQWHGNEVFKETLSALVLSGDIHMDTLILHGCKPSSSYHMITRAEENVVFEMNGRPATEVISELWGADSDIDLDDFPLLVTLGVNRGDKFGDFKEENYANRLCFAVDKEQSALVMFEPDLKTGAEVQLMRRSIGFDYIGPRVENLFKNLKGEKPVFAFYIDCLGRAAAFCGMDKEEAEEVQKFIPAGVPLLGIYSGVEIGKIGADVQALDWTGVLCVFSQ